MSAAGLRAPRSQDAEAVLELLLARDVADLGHPDFDLEHLLADWRMPEVDLELDGWLAEQDGRLNGYALRIDRNLVLAVRPGAEGQGIGTALRRSGEARARAVGCPAVRQVTAGSNDLARRALEEAGYVRIQHHERLLADLAAVTPGENRLPLRAFDPGRDSRAVWELEQSAFAEHDGFVPTSFEGWCAQGPQRGDFEAGLWLLHHDEAGLAGIVLCQRWEEDDGYVETLAVARRARGRGLGRALLACGLEVLRGAGARRAFLHVDLANAPATGLYASVGFRPAWRSERWQKELA